MLYETRIECALLALGRKVLNIATTEYWFHGLPRSLWITAPYSSHDLDINKS